MADVLKGLFGGSKSSEMPVPSADSDFADFAEPAEPSPVPVTPFQGGATLTPQAPAATLRPYTKWYRLNERYTLNDFRNEGVILACIVFIFTLHIIGSRLNRSKARKWIRAHAATLTSEFALVGFDNVPTLRGSDGGEADALLAGATPGVEADRLIREKSLFEFATYATGRQNVAFMDVKLTLIRRFNPLVSILEAAMSVFFESMPAPADTVEAVLYPFDGKEVATVPGVPGAAEARPRDARSAYDNFVWAVVNKDRMKAVRDDRYDVSITFTKDNPKLPVWLTVMSESAEITDALLTPELAKAAEKAGDLLDYVIISDQPVDKPKTLDETAPRKRVFLKYHLPSDGNYEPLLPIFEYFIRVADQLARDAHFRPEVARKVRNVREDLARQIQKADREEKDEERTSERDRQKKARRDQELAALDAKGQKRYLEREREKGLRKQQKKMTSRA